MLPQLARLPGLSLLDKEALVGKVDWQDPSAVQNIHSQAVRSSLGQHDLGLVSPE